MKTESEYNVPFKIVRSTDSDNQACRLTIEMPWEIAEQLHQAFMPFIVQLSQSVTESSQREAERLHMLDMMQDAHRRKTFIVLRMIRQARKLKLEPHELATQYAMQYDIDDNELIHAAALLKKERTTRLRRFRDRYIVRLHQAGMRPAALTKQLGLSPWAIRQIIAKTQKQLDACYV